MLKYLEGKTSNWINSYCKENKTDFGIIYAVKYSKVKFYNRTLCFYKFFIRTSQF